MGKIQESKRKLQTNTIPQLKRGGNIITSPEDIADHNANISRDAHKKVNQGKTERARKKRSYHIIDHSHIEK